MLERGQVWLVLRVRAVFGRTFPCATLPAPHHLCVMTLEEFHKSLSSERPPEGLTLSLAALWWDAKGDWKKAHESAQQDEGPAGAWVHAYLHRKEGDLSNAGYWYRQAGKPQANVSLEKEWAEIVSSLLDQKHQRR